MIRGWFTAVSGMRAQQWRLDTVGNNLANVNTDGFKRGQAVFKAFPQMLMRRMNDDGVYLHPFGSADMAPVIGRLGTGVEFNELYVSLEQGPLRETHSDFDIALDGPGFFAISTPWGERYTRNGSFFLGMEGYLMTKSGFQVLGENGPIRVQANNFQIDREGRVWVNAEYGDDPNTMIARERNEWNDTVLLDTLRIVNFDVPRYLRQQGTSLFFATEISGPPHIMETGERPSVWQGFIEAANVEPVREMIQMIEINRAYEANSRVIQTHDSMLGTLINQVGRIT